MERVKGIEPSYEAWEAAVLPLNYTRAPGSLAPTPGSAAWLHSRLPPVPSPLVDMRRLLLLFVSCCVLLAGCAGLAGVDPLRVTLAGIEPLPGQGMEMRMAVKLRVQNSNDAAVDFDGAALTLEVRGMDFASGVSDQRGSVPRFGETVITVPVTV